MANRFTLQPGLEETVALMMVPRIDEIAREVQLSAKRLAPGTKVWVTLQDGRVCTHCQPLSLQELPSNLRFEAKSYDWDIKERGMGRYTYLLFPQDPSAGGPDLVMVTHCRCFLLTNPDGLSKDINTTAAKAAGKTVRATIYIDGDHVVDAEQGTSYDSGRHIVLGAHFMRGAAVGVAQRRRGLSGGGDLAPPTLGGR